MVDPLDLHVLTHSSPTRRSSDLNPRRKVAQRGLGEARLAGEIPQRRGRGDGAAEGDQRVAMAVELVGVRAAVAAHIGAAGVRRIGPPIIALRIIILRSEEHTSELKSLIRNSYAVFCMKKKI